MDADPANICIVNFLKTKCKNYTTGSSLFAVPKVLPV